MGDSVANSLHLLKYVSPFPVLRHVLQSECGNSAAPHYQLVRQSISAITCVGHQLNWSGKLPTMHRCSHINLLAASCCGEAYRDICTRAFLCVCTHAISMRRWAALISKELLQILALLFYDRRNLHAFNTHMVIVIFNACNDIMLVFISSLFVKVTCSYQPLLC